MAFSPASSFCFSKQKQPNLLKYFPNDIKVVHKLALNADLSKLLTYQKSLNTIKSYAQTSVNKEINLNSVMIEYKKIFTD